MAVKRVYIRKSNGKLRPLGIRTVLERIIQECIKIIIEPIVEDAFYDIESGTVQGGSNFTITGKRVLK